MVFWNVKNFLKICDGINVEPITLAILQNPDLWDQRTLRKHGNSPHTQMSDIWVRYNDDTDAKRSGDYSKFNDEHFPIWYPAIEILPSIRQIALGLMAKMGATHLGGILITKIPSGGKVDPHVDRGWHADFYNCKLYVPLLSLPGCVNRCDDEFVSMKTGECWYFNNHVEHEVINNSNDDRMTLIICMKTDD
jgi:hypothetical protein